MRYVFYQTFYLNLFSRTVNAARDRVIRRKEEKSLATLIHSPLNLSSLKFDEKVTVVSPTFSNNRELAISDSVELAIFDRTYRTIIKILAFFDLFDFPNFSSNKPQGEDLCCRL